MTRAVELCHSVLGVCVFNTRSYGIGDNAEDSITEVRNRRVKRGRRRVVVASKGEGKSTTKSKLATLFSETLTIYVQRHHVQGESECLNFAGPRSANRIFLQLNVQCS